MIQFLKICTKCRKQKWNSSFSKQKNNSDGLASRCKDCSKEQSARNHQNNPQQNRINNLKSKFKITVEEYELMLKSQNDVCKICKQPETKKDRNSNIQLLSVDRNHLTVKIRGLLCDNCNVMLGRAKDDIEILKQAIKYLEDNQ